MQVRIGSWKKYFPRYVLFIAFFVVLKIILAGLFSSDYQDQLFLPFVRSFLDGTAKGNPYNYYYENGLPSSFPYPPLMLLIESIAGRLLLGFEKLGIAAVFIQNLVFKLPILAFDVLGLVVLQKLFPDRKKYIGVLYFASPIIIYSSYMHGQLDIIPTSLLLASLYFLTKRGTKNRVAFILLFSGAILSKQHIIAVLPLVFCYSFNKYKFKQTVTSVAAIVAICSLIVLPFWGEGFIRTVIFNNEQMGLTQVYLSFANVHMLLPILVLTLVYLMYFSMKSINTSLFFSYCGILFSVFLIFVLPMPGWYVWIVPYVTMFFAQVSYNKYNNLIIFFGLNFIYIIYFVFFHKSGLNDLIFMGQVLNTKLDELALRNICFTLLEGMLIFSTYIMYQFGIASNSVYKRKNLPFTIGISGDSGSGKSRLMELVNNILAPSDVLKIEGDGDHRWERGEKMWQQYTHLNPRANYLYRQASDISQLRKGAAVSRVEYDHSLGNFTEEAKITPKPYILICGLHSLYLPQMRKMLDLKIYLDTDTALKHYWKVRRDTKKRNYSPEKVLKQIEDRNADYEKYILPQKEYADLVIQYFDPNLPKEYNDSYEENLSLRITLSTAIDMEPLIMVLAQYGIEIKFDFSKDLERQNLVIINEGIDKTFPFIQVVNNLIPLADEIAFLDDSMNEKDCMQQIIALLILYYISEKMKEEI